MTTVPGAPARPLAREARPARARRLATVLLGPLWVRTFRDPVRQGHLRLDALSRTERQLARAGLVLLGLLLVSVLFGDVWREGTLYQLLGSNELRFVPVAVLPLTLLGLVLGWALLAWGALDAAPSVRVLVAVLFWLTASVLVTGTPGMGIAGGGWFVAHGGTLMRTGYLVTGGVLLASAALHPLLRRRARAQRVATSVARGLALAGVVALFATPLPLHLQAESAGLPARVPAFVDTSIGLVLPVLLPLVYVSAVAVIDFALDVSESVSEPTRVLARPWLLALVGGLLAAKIAHTLLLRRDVWVSAVLDQPVALVRTLVSLALLGALVALATRFPRSEDFQLAKERVMYAGSFAFAAPYLLSVLGAGLGQAAYTFLGSQVGFELSDALPVSWLGTWGLLLAAAAAAAAGVWLMRRSAGGFGDELGSALVVVGGWNVVVMTPLVLDWQLGFTYAAVDVVVTVAAAVVLVLGWRRLSAAALVALTTLVVFTWLVTSRGDYLSFLGALIGLPGILVVVFGVVLTLASGSSFASSASRRLPTDARPMLFVGYLLFSVVILHWVQVTHETGSDADALAGFFFLGLPMAAWLAGRRIVPR